MKSWHPSLPSFNPFVIVFYFLFRRLAKSFTPKINDYYYDHAAYPVQRYVPPAMDPGYEQPAKYV